MTEREKVSLAFLASILLHLLLLGLMMLWEVLWPKTLKPAQPDKPIEVTLVSPNPTPTPSPLTLAAVEPTPTPTPSPTPKPMKLLREFLDITGLHQSEKAPENAPFESDRNSEAASELPANGTVPLPSQDGKVRPFQQFTNMDFALGKASPAPLQAQEATPAPAPEVSRPKEEGDLPPDLMPEPVATPTPLPQNAFAIAKPTPVPKLVQPKPVTQAKPTPRPSQLRLEMPKTKVVPGNQPYREMTKIEGNISNRGRSGVAAFGTPLGRYKQAITDSISSLWNLFIQQKEDLVTAGVVQVNFFVNKEGHVERIRLISNTANESLATYSIRAVTESHFQPPPVDVLQALPDGELEITFTFNLVD